MIASFSIREIGTDQAAYRPGEEVALLVQLEADCQEPVVVRARASIMHLAEQVAVLEKLLEVPSGISNFEFRLLPPEDSPRGYGADVTIFLEGGEVLASASVAFDVLQSWTESPRYGFLVDFAPGKNDVPGTLKALNRYHVNGLQFYDWMYRHDQFLTADEPYQDPLGRELSLLTVEALIEQAHSYNIAAMPYTAIYASSDAFYQDHKDWAIYQASGDPFRLGEDFLVYMDPRPDSPWTKHLLEQFAEILRETAFDGIHLDQYGDPKAAQDAAGTSFSLDDPIAETIDLTKELVEEFDPGHAVIFNAVNNWPIEKVARSRQDLVYIEVWPPHVTYQDIHRLIVEAQELSSGKPVVLAAYIDPIYVHTARLLDAVIFASGGGHIELGETNGMLADPYFPLYQTMSLELQDAMAAYYDFQLRYQDVIGPRTEHAGEDFKDRIQVEGVNVDSALQTHKVWPIFRRGEGFLAVNLINLLGLESPEWTAEVSRPPLLEDFRVKLDTAGRGVNTVWTASPDRPARDPQPLDFETYQDGAESGIIFRVPELAFWQLVVIEWSD